jgi:hypothetical protein
VSATPPPFAPPTRKKNTTLIVVIVLVCLAIPCIGTIALGLMGLNVFNKAIKPAAGCAIAFTDLQRAMERYADDHDGKLPDAAKWQELIKTYYFEQSSRRDAGPFDVKLAKQGPWGCDTDGDGKLNTGIAFNSQLAGKKLDEIKDPYSTVLLFEIEEPALNASMPYKPLPRETGPFILGGERREWFRVNVKGGVEGFDSEPGSSRRRRSEAEGKEKEKEKEKAGVGAEAEPAAPKGN